MSVGCDCDGWGFCDVLFDSGFFPEKYCFSEKPPEVIVAKLPKILTGVGLSLFREMSSTTFSGIQRGL
jgi:hypothetical protein